jgi:MerR family copper efflux transcriptional regulator
MNDTAITAQRFNIGEAAARSGVSAKMVRHYESLGLLPTVARTDSGYRQYGEREVHTLRFIRRGRDLGFSMAEIAELLKLYQNRRRASGDVKRIALAHVADLERRMNEMAEMKRTLEHLAHCCHGDERPDCPILDELGQRGMAGTAV